jgi:hypothetical protein
MVTPMWSIQTMSWFVIEAVPLSTRSHLGGSVNSDLERRHSKETLIAAKSSMIEIAAELTQ